MWLRVCPTGAQGNKMEKLPFSAPPRFSVFLLLKVGFLDVKSLIEHNGER